MPALVLTMKKKNKQKTQGLDLKFILESYFTKFSKFSPQVPREELKFPFEKETKTTLVQKINYLANKKPICHGIPK